MSKLPCGWNVYQRGSPWKARQLKRPFQITSGPGFWHLKRRGWYRRLWLPLAIGLTASCLCWSLLTYTASKLNPYGWPKDLSSWTSTFGFAQAGGVAPQVGYIRNCAVARALGVAPLHRARPGYSPHLDADGDGIACEAYLFR